MSILASYAEESGETDEPFLVRQYADPETDGWAWAIEYGFKEPLMLVWSDEAAAHEIVNILNQAIVAERRR